MQLFEPSFFGLQWELVLLLIPELCFYVHPRQCYSLSPLPDSLNITGAGSGTNILFWRFRLNRDVHNLYSYPNN